MRTRKIRDPAVRFCFDDERVLTIRNGRFADPQRIGEALASVAARNGGRLQPEDTVDAARDPKSALHPHFDWDDTVAAEKWRLEQARLLIRSIRVEDDTRSYPPPAFLSIREVDRGTSYRFIGEVVRSAELQDAVLQAADRDLAAWQRRYNTLKDLCEQVEVVRERIRVRRAKPKEQGARPQAS